MRVFQRLGEFTYCHRWAVVLAWVAVVVVSAFLAPNLGARLKGGGFEGANSEAERVQALMSDEFGVSPATLTIVFDGGSLPAKGDEFQRREAAALQGLQGMRETEQVTTYSDSEDPRFISEDGKKSYALVSFNVSSEETEDLVAEVRNHVRSGSMKTYVTGAPAVYQDITEASNQDIKRAEKYAFPFALVILVIAFGTLVAASIPVVIGGVSVLTALATLYFVAGAYDMSVFVLTISTMLGLGLGIDYALFAVSRFREELEHYPVPEAVPRMVATAGRSIFFSGTAVLIGLSGLLFFPFMFMRSIGVAGVIVVFVSVTAALTLLPASLGIIGHRINSLSVRRRSVTPGIGFWSRSAEIVMRHPVIVLFIVAVMLAGLLYPVGHMRVGIPEASVLPDKYESRAGDDVLKKDFDYADLNPMEVISTLPDTPSSAEGLAAIEQLGDRIEGKNGVASVESLYTIGADGAREYARQIAGARKKAEAEAGKRVDGLVEERIQAQIQKQTDITVQQQLDDVQAQYGTIPPGTEEQIRAKVGPKVEEEVRGAEGRIRAEVEQRVAEEVDRKVPDLPSGISPEGDVTPEGVANFLNTPEARDSEEIRGALGFYSAGDRTLLRVVPKANPYTEEARAAVDEVRSVQPPDGSSFLVGGLSAGQKDFISSLYGDAPFAAAFVLGVTYLILFLTFRSVFIPLKAVVVNILSLTASFGAMVFVFQDGNLSGLLNFTPLGFVDATLPILMFCTVFGVSMDYEVFLLSRIREAYENGDSNTASVAKGLVATAGIITSAAAIIIVVTGAFSFTGIIITKAVGLGLAVAVFVDATIIRILLVPATMRILGDWNWWPGGRKRTFGSKPEKSKPFHG